MRVGLDVGGTFTDVVFQDEDGRVHATRLLSLLPTPGLDISGLTAPERAEGKQFRYIHATTIPSNAVLEGKVARPVR